MLFQPDLCRFRWINTTLRTKPLEIKEQHQKQLRELQEGYADAMLELRARKKLASLLGVIPPKNQMGEK